MLQDYEIKQKTTKIERIIPYAEFILILIIIQCILALFTGVESQEETIRFRLLAHSNSAADQAMKEEIQLEIQPLIENAVLHSTSKKELGEKLAALEPMILQIASTIAGDVGVTLERKEAALFPAKKSGFVIYPQSEYDAYLLTIGSGRGDNWWCALFPKICYPEEEKQPEEEKVTFFVWEWITGLFS